MLRNRDARPLAPSPALHPPGWTHDRRNRLITWLLYLKRPGQFGVDPHEGPGRKCATCAPAHARPQQMTARQRQQGSEKVFTREKGRKRPCLGHSSATNQRLYRSSTSRVRPPATRHSPISRSGSRFRQSNCFRLHQRASHHPNPCGTVRGILRNLHARPCVYLTSHGGVRQGGGRKNIPTCRMRSYSHDRIT